MLKSKKGQVSRSVIILSLALFYAVLFVFYYYIGQSALVYGSTWGNWYSINNANDNAKINECLKYTTDGSGSSTASAICLKLKGVSAGISVNETTHEVESIQGFRAYIPAGISIVPWWLNTILFLPLAAFFIYLLLVGFIPTIDAGA